MLKSNPVDKINKSKFKLSLSILPDELKALIPITEKRILAIWAKDCAERVLPYFEKDYSHDKRPRKALDTLQNWIDTGKFKMSVIRKASLNAHAAAREAREDSPARSAARAAGQAVATAHVYTHSLGPVLYGLQAISRASDPVDHKKLLAKEIKWQHEHLVKLRAKYSR